MFYCSLIFRLYLVTAHQIWGFTDTDAAKRKHLMITLCLSKPLSMFPSSNSHFCFQLQGKSFIKCTHRFHCWHPDRFADGQIWSAAKTWTPNTVEFLQKVDLSHHCLLLFCKFSPRFLMQVFHHISENALLCNYLENIVSQGAN